MDPGAADASSDALCRAGGKRVPDYLSETVQQLLELKMNALEVKMIPKIAILNDYMVGSIAEVKEQIEKLSKEAVQDWDELNQLFLSLLEM